MRRTPRTARGPGHTRGAGKPHPAHGYSLVRGAPGRVERDGEPAIVEPGHPVTAGCRALA